MKKILINASILLTVVSLSACSNESQIKGSDYISTNVGSTYNYGSHIEANDSDKGMQVSITVQKCDQNNTLCDYISKASDENGEYLEGSEYKYSYAIKNGAVYTVLPNIADEELFPEDIKFNVIKKYDISADEYVVNGSYSFTKQIPEITVNNTIYKNCIELDGNSIRKNKDDKNETAIVSKVASKEVYCKDVGLVTETVSMSNGSDAPKNSVINLESITK
jgi:hypothetical protein